MEALPRLGANFIMQAVRYFLIQTKLSKKYMRWANFFSMFHFDIVHMDGKKNVVAYALASL